MNSRLGVDLGQSTDNSTYAAVEIVGQNFVVRGIRRMPLGLDYVAEEGKPSVAWTVVEVVRRMLAADAAKKLKAAEEQSRRGVHVAPERAYPPLVVIDGTGVGAAVVNIMRVALQGMTEMRVVEIAPGTDKVERVKEANGMPYVRVGKEYLISHLTGLMQQDRIIANRSLPEWIETVQQFKSFERRTNPTTLHTSFNAKSGAHDDLVIALALAVLDDIPSDPQAIHDLNELLVQPPPEGDIHGGVLDGRQSMFGMRW